jgi:putative transposase
LIEREHQKLSIVTQCKLLKINRSTLYYEQKPARPDDATILERITNIYEETPFFGYRRLHVELAKEGYKHNLKRTRRLKKMTGLKTIYPSKKTTIANQAHKKYPYLLKGLQIDHPNQVWQVDITYIKLRHGFAYLTCLIDVFSRKIMGCEVSPFLDAKPCFQALEMALKLA